MKPSLLTMSGYGPYAKMVQVPFDQFDGRGLFLITGDTGAGKTTIFDAITYALFGSVSGSTRTLDTLRSDFAQEDTETYVELIFHHKGAKYHVYRSPQYERAKKRGDGTTSKQAEAVLTLPDGRVITKWKEVNAEMENILGVDYKQWTQIAMIAQGEFLNLLNANSTTRGEIFRRIFNTGVFVNIQSELGGMLSHAKKEREHCERSLLEYAGDISCEPEDIHFEPIQEIRENKTIHMLSDVRVLLDQIIEADGEKEGQLMNQIGQLDVQLHKITAEKAVADKFNLSFVDLKHHEKELESLELKNEEMRKKATLISLAKKAMKIIPLEIEYNRANTDLTENKNSCSSLEKLIEIQQEKVERTQIEYNEKEKNRERINHLIGEIAKLEGKIPQYEAADALRKEILRESKQQDDLKQYLLMSIKKQEEIFEKKEALLLIPQLHMECKLQLEQKKNTQVSIGQKMETLEEILDHVKNHEQQCIAYDDEAERYFKLEEEAQEEQSAYNGLELTYLREQAGILAQSLMEGQPCPVCGAIEHPNKAKLSQGALTKEELDVKKGTLELRLNKLRESSQHLGIKKAELFTLEENIRRQAIKVIEEAKAYFDLGEINSVTQEIIKIEAWIYTYLNMLQTQDHAMKQEILYLKEKVNLFEKQEEELSNIDLKLQGIEKTIKKLERDLQDLSGILLGKKGQLSNIEENLAGFFSKEEATLKINEMRKKKDEFEDEMQLAEKNHLNAKKALDENQAIYGEKKRVLPLCEEEWDKSKSNYEKEITLCGFENELEYKEAILSQEEIQKLDGEVDFHLSKVKEIKGLIVYLQNQTQGKEWISTERYDEEMKKLEGEKNEKNSIVKIISHRISQNKGVKEKINHAEIQYAALEKNYMMVKSLSDTANGNLSGKPKVAFEQYVQAAYFELIIEQANKRLTKMTGNRYELKRKEHSTNLQAQVAFELDVFDHYTGKVRTVKSLSGGESFKAALSLALGLSDVIQNSLGGVQIETLFIDEGFGSLDSESIDQAIKVLSQLTEGNRLIGIISHVAELKESIEKKILVSHCKASGGYGGSSLKLLV